eukprot:1156124-Pelagomonas_calceolata.AAC.3
MAATITLLAQCTVRSASAGKLDASAQLTPPPPRPRTRPPPQQRHPGIAGTRSPARASQSTMASGTTS